MAFSRFVTTAASVLVVWSVANGSATTSVLAQSQPVEGTPTTVTQEETTATAAIDNAFTTNYGFGPMVTTHRGIDDLVSYNDIAPECNFVGKVVFGQPASLTQGDRFYRFGQILNAANQITIDQINKGTSFGGRCGINLSSGNYAIELRNYDDHSNVNATIAIGEQILFNPESDIDIVIGGYSSTTSMPLAEIAQERSKLFLAPAAVATSVFKDRDMVFGTLIPGNKFLVSSIEGLSKVGAKTIVTMNEDAGGPRSLCSGVADIAPSVGMEILQHHEVVATPNVTVLEPIAQNISQPEVNPDVVVTCFYDCVPWIEAMRKVNWSPKAQVFTICVGSKSMEEAVGTDKEYMIGANAWDRSLPNSVDAVTGFTPYEFATKFVTQSS